MSELTTKDALLERAVAALEKIKTAMGEINPTGVIQAFAGNTLPDGWLLCDGTAVSRETYADLYAVIGDTYGDGDGSTTFNLPDLTNKFVQGNSTAGTVKTAGLPDITGSFNARQSVGFGHNSNGNVSGAFYKDTSYTANLYAVGIESATGLYNMGFKASGSNSIYGSSDTVQPPALTMRYIIKY